MGVDQPTGGSPDIFRVGLFPSEFEPRPRGSLALGGGLSIRECWEAVPAVNVDSCDMWDS